MQGPGDKEKTCTHRARDTPFLAYRNTGSPGFDDGEAKVLRIQRLRSDPLSRNFSIEVWIPAPCVLTERDSQHRHELKRDQIVAAAVPKPDGRGGKQTVKPS